MQLELTTDLVPKRTLEAFPEPGVPARQWKPAAGPNYLVYDASRKSPTGFAIHVGKKASVYLVEKLVAGKNMKIHVGLARERTGDEQVIDLDTARDRARELVATAKKHGANPKAIADRIEALHLTSSFVYLTRSLPIEDEHAGHTRAVRKASNMLSRLFAIGQLGSSLSRPTARGRQASSAPAKTSRATRLSASNRHAQVADRGRLQRRSGARTRRCLLKHPAQRRDGPHTSRAEFA